MRVTESTTPLIDYINPMVPLEFKNISYFEEDCLIKQFTSCIPITELDFNR